MSTSSKGQRVIGIRHALKQFKTAGLVEEDTAYPVQAVQAEMLAIAQRWYKVGYRRGAREVIGAFLCGTFEAWVDKDGARAVVANKAPITWKRALNVTVGNTKQRIPKQDYELTLPDLEFDDVDT